MKMKAHNDQYWNFTCNIYFFHNLNKYYQFLKNITTTCNSIIALRSLIEALVEKNHDEIFPKYFNKYFSWRLANCFSYIKHFISIFLGKSDLTIDIAKELSKWIDISDNSYNQEVEIEKEINEKYELLFISSKNSQLDIKNKLIIQNYQYSLVSAISFPLKQLFFKDKDTWFELNSLFDITQTKNFPPNFPVSFLCYKYESDITENLPKKRINEEYSPEEIITKQQGYENESDINENLPKKRSSEEYPPEEKPIKIRKLIRSFSKIGIPNIGSTCYLNSVLQILASTPDFLENLSSKTPLENSLKNVVNSLKNCKTENIERNIKNLKNELGRNFPMFFGHNQHDSKELFLQIISFYNESHLQNPFFEITINQIFKCHNRITHKSYNDEKELFMTVPFHYLNIKNYLDDKIMPKEFINENQLYCENCKKLVNTTLNIFHINYPKTLAFYLPKRNENWGSTRRELKDFREIEINRKDYWLYGVICYYGVSTYGHYIAYTINIEGEWEKYNDISITSEVPDFDNAYMLFYKVT